MVSVYDDSEGEMPQRINVMKVITYDVSEVIETIKDARNNDDEITIDDVMEYVQNMVKDDFSCGWGHEANLRELIFQDENGNDL